MVTDNKTSLEASGMTPGRAVRWVDILPESHGRGIIASSQQNASALLKQPEAWSQPDKEATLMSDHTSPQSKSTNYVYLIEPDGDSFTKIGITDDPKKRLCQLQTGNPRLLVLRYVIPCEGADEAYSIEQYLHFAFGRYAAMGEWFEISADSIIAFWRQTGKIAELASKRQVSEPNLSFRGRELGTVLVPVKTQQDVVDFLEANPDATDLPGKEIARLTGASEATVSRARRGFSANGHGEASR